MAYLADEIDVEELYEGAISQIDRGAPTVVVRIPDVCARIEAAGMFGNHTDRKGQRDLNVEVDHQEGVIIIRPDQKLVFEQLEGFKLRGLSLAIIPML